MLLSSLLSPAVRHIHISTVASCYLSIPLRTGTWDEVPTVVRAKVGARLGSMGALRGLDAALRLLAQHGTSDLLHEV